jgi:16S rRNA (adenine1518-N6/adenine1519-N6)-dimethyltransferase
LQRRSERIKPKKSLGQNFLVDDRVIGRIIDAVSSLPGDIVVEIGPGKGALTRSLLERAGFVVAVEIDPRLAAHLRERFHQENFLLVEADALTEDWGELVSRASEMFGRLRHKNADGSRARVVANLPYYISTPIVERLIRSGRVFDDLTLMLQKEVVERITSGPGSKDYGYLSVLVQYYTEATKLFDVPPSSFKPAPKVWSSVARLRMRDRPPIVVDDTGRFFAMVRAAFSQRRKTLANNLKASMRFTGIEGGIEDVYERAGIDPRRRAETLSVEEFGILYRELHKN